MWAEPRFHQAASELRRKTSQAGFSSPPSAFLLQVVFFPPPTSFSFSSPPAASSVVAASKKTEAAEAGETSVVLSDPLKMFPRGEASFSLFSLSLLPPASSRDAEILSNIKQHSLLSRQCGECFCLLCVCRRAEPTRVHNAFRLVLGNKHTINGTSERINGKRAEATPRFFFAYK